MLSNTLPFKRKSGISKLYRYINADKKMYICVYLKIGQSAINRLKKITAKKSEQRGSSKVVDQFPIIKVYLKRFKFSYFLKRDLIHWKLIIVTQTGECRWRI